MRTAEDIGFDVRKIREDFPILGREVNGHPLVYFDNAATAQKPKAVLNAIQDYYTTINSNIHRGVHHLSELATRRYEEARAYIAGFINARHTHEVNFVRGTTEGINLVASAWGRKFVRPGDEIIITHMEHHSNVVPWQMLCEETGAVLRAIPVTDTAELDLAAFEKLLSAKTRLVAVSHTSNATGVINPLERIIKMVHDAGALVLVDGAQAVPHTAVDMQALDCDFFAFSGHKVFGPTGIGILYGKEHLLEAMNPYMGGGEMIETVTIEKTTYNKLPYKFEAGTPHIEGGIVLAEALKYVTSIGYDNIHTHEQELLLYATKALKTIDGLKIYGDVEDKSSVVSFNIGDLHPYDIGVLLDQQGIAIRTGHHCCMPLMQRLGIPGTCRASLAFYNTKEEVDRLVSGLARAASILEN
jgi:cysteine desulfurase/selenocysteine lyase